MKLPRQFGRYYTSTREFYHEYNFQISLQLDSISRLLKGEMHLDLGCGEVPFRSFYQKNYIHYQTADIVQNSSGTVHFLLPADWATLPFKSSSFSSVALFDVIEHLPNDVAALTEVHRILKPNGFLVATIPFLYRLHEFPFDYRRYTYVGILNLLERTSFDPLIITPIGSPSFIIKTLAREATLSIPRNYFMRFFYRFIRRLLICLPNIFDTDFYTSYGFFILAKIK